MDKEKALLKIAAEIEKCALCKKWGKGKAVPGEGNPNAKIVFIGEAPGKKEAETGRSFVGRSGKFLRQMIRKAGIDEEKIYITSPVKYLPAAGTPSPGNITHSRSHLIKQLSIIDPDIIVLLGNTACLALLQRKVRLAGEHGNTVYKNGKTYFITFHPAYAARFPDGKKKFMSDFEKLRALAAGFD